ncbi:hypothetical protein FB451DRAFT_1177991 [Mycena latifolia]|nr:hypothetical protein FB451DRAFT_1177991 [Mycena latifolia]
MPDMTGRDGRKSQILQRLNPKGKINVSMQCRGTGLTDGHDSLRKTRCEPTSHRAYVLALDLCWSILKNWVIYETIYGYCAQNADGTLREARDIVFYDDVDDERPISGPKVSSSTWLRPFFTGSAKPAGKIAGARRSSRTSRPSAHITGPDNAESSVQAGKRKAPAVPAAPRKASRTSLLGTTDAESDNGAPGGVGDDTEGEDGEGQEVMDLEEYEATKAMADADHAAAIAKAPRTDSTAYIRTVFTRIKKYNDPKSGNIEDGSLCKICVDNGGLHKKIQDLLGEACDNGDIDAADVAKVLTTLDKGGDDNEDPEAKLADSEWTTGDAVRMSPQAREFFKKCCVQVSVPQLKLLLWVCTRWGSLYKCLSRVLELRKAIDRFTLIADSSDEVPPLRNKTYGEYRLSPAEWERIVMIHEALRERVPTVWRVIPTLEYLIKRWETMSEHPRYTEISSALTDGTNSLRKWFHRADTTSNAYFICLATSGQTPSHEPAYAPIDGRPDTVNSTLVWYARAWLAAAHPRRGVRLQRRKRACANAGENFLVPRLRAPKRKRGETYKTDRSQQRRTRTREINDAHELQDPGGTCVAKCQKENKGNDPRKADHKLTWPPLSRHGLLFPLFHVALDVAHPSAAVLRRKAPQLWCMLVSLSGTLEKPFLSVEQVLRSGQFWVNQRSLERTESELYTGSSIIADAFLVRLYGRFHNLRWYPYLGLTQRASAVAAASWHLIGI